MTPRLLNRCGIVCAALAAIYCGLGMQPACCLFALWGILFAAFAIGLAYYQEESP